MYKLLVPVEGQSIFSLAVILNLKGNMRKENDKLFKNAELQIHIDIPRMNPLVAIFQQKLVQEVSTLLSLYPACSSYLVLDIVDGNSYSTLSSL